MDTNWRCLRIDFGSIYFFLLLYAFQTMPFSSFLFLLCLPRLAKSKAEHSRFISYVCLSRARTNATMEQLYNHTNWMPNKSIQFPGNKNSIQLFKCNTIRLEWMRMKKHTNTHTHTYTFKMRVTRFLPSTYGLSTFGLPVS